MATVEEAWDEFDREMAYLPEATVIYRLRTAARELALAVLEEATEAHLEYRDGRYISVPTWLAHELRTRIEKLGLDKHPA